MRCPNCRSTDVLTVVTANSLAPLKAPLTVVGFSCQDCGMHWTQKDSDTTRPCPSCGRDLDGIFHCRQCEEGVQEPLRREASRQGRAIALLKRDESFLAVKLIGNNTYAAVVRLLFGARIIVGHVDDVYGYEKGWDYTHDIPFTGSVAAMEAFRAWSGAGEPSGYTRALPGNDRSQTTDPVLKEWPL